MRLLKLITSISVLLAAAVPSLAEGAEESMPFGRIDRNPATAGMAFTGAASTSSIAWSSFVNSAVLPFYNGSFDAALSWQNWAPDAVKSSNLNVGAAYRINDIAGVSLGFATQSFESYDVIDQYGMPNGTFTPSVFVINGGFGVRFASFFSVGVNARYLSQKLTDGRTISAVCGDLMLLYKPYPGMGLTAGISSVGSGVKSVSGDSFNLHSAKVAGDFATCFACTTLKVDLDMDYYFSGKFCAGIGAECGYQGLAFLRAGYHFGGKDAVLPSFATVGAGFRLSGISLDFAYLTANDSLGGSITIGLRYSF